MSHTVQDKKVQFKESLLPKTEPNSCKKWHLTKMFVPKKPETNSVRSKNAAYKNDRGQKIGAKQLKIKMAPYRNDCGEKNLSLTV